MPKDELAFRPFIDLPFLITFMFTPTPETELFGQSAQKSFNTRCWSGLVVVKDALLFILTFLRFRFEFCFIKSFQFLGHQNAFGRFSALWNFSSLGFVRDPDVLSPAPVQSWYYLELIQDLVVLSLPLP